jgi:hypothetical protein
VLYKHEGDHTRRNEYTVSLIPCEYSRTKNGNLLRHQTPNKLVKFFVNSQRLTRTLPELEFASSSRTAVYRHPIHNPDLNAKFSDVPVR